MKLNSVVFLIIIAPALAGCATVRMTPLESQTLDPVNQDRSRVVFLRSSFIGSAIGASIFELVDGEPKFIGMLQNNTKIAIDTNPGKHVYMVYSEAADYMEASLGGGRTYYSIITPRMGAWKARFSMWPIRKEHSADYSMKSKDFSKWTSNAKYVVNNDKTLQWVKDNYTKVVSKHREYWPVWKNKSTRDLNRRTLHDEDGI